MTWIYALIWKEAFVIVGTVAFGVWAERKIKCEK